MELRYRYIYIYIHYMIYSPVKITLGNGRSLVEAGRSLMIPCFDIILWFETKLTWWLSYVPTDPSSPCQMIGVYNRLWNARYSGSVKPISGGIAPLPKLNCLPLKNGGTGRRSFPIGSRYLFRGELLNFGRVDYLFSGNQTMQMYASFEGLPS